MPLQPNQREEREREKEIEKERVGLGGGAAAAAAIMSKNRWHFLNYLASDKQKSKHWFFLALALALVVLIGTALLISALIGTISFQDSILCSFNGGAAFNSVDTHYLTTPTQLLAVLHYATSKVTPQQSVQEIRVTFDVLRSLSPCNFLVFGLGYDSLMWSAFNPRGTTLFLEEDPKWVQSVLKDFPTLHAQTVRYRTQLSQADHLLKSSRSEPYCRPGKAYLRENYRCKLALTGLPDEVYETEWDLIMIDAPRGYYAEAPGRMGAIFSAAVMARARVGSGVTHVFLHDVDRKVEKMFAQEFLCFKYRVNHVGRLWHFEIPPANKNNSIITDHFC
ncbi:probable methyltransferase At1g27930 [Telopea speciosissima]|uniref:probable methyltransferase At1g27930 n=1 Tax=Telopea speciosissima TaxID=54955 RepID=UPI001CC3FA9A|nr:probable methyltransferase At1g27930 [Telopea speciosissima]